MCFGENVPSVLFKKKNGFTGKGYRCDYFMVLSTFTYNRVLQLKFIFIQSNRFPLLYDSLFIQNSTRRFFSYVWYVFCPKVHNMRNMSYFQDILKSKRLKTSNNNNLLGCLSIQMGGKIFNWLFDIRQSWILLLLNFSNNILTEQSLTVILIYFKNLFFDTIFTICSW